MIIKDFELFSKYTTLKTINESFDYSSIEFPVGLALRQIVSADAIISIKYDSISELTTINLKIIGVAKMRCAITNEIVDYNYTIDDEVVYSSDPNNIDTITIENRQINTYNIVYDSIVTSLPTYFVKEGVELKQETQKEEKTIDPRLAKLKDLFK